MNVNRLIARAIGVVVVSGAVALGPAVAAGAATQPLLPPDSPIQIGLGNGPIIDLNPQTPPPTVPTAVPSTSDLVGRPQSDTTASSDPDAIRVGSETSTPASTSDQHHAASADLPVDVCISRSILTGSDVNGCGTAQGDTPSLIPALESLGACVEQAIGLGGSAADCGVTPVPGAPDVPAVPTVPGVPTVPAVPTVPGVPTVPAVPTVPGDSALPVLPVLPVPSVGSGPSSVLDEHTVGNVVHDTGLCPVTERLGVHFSESATGSDGSGPATPTDPGTGTDGNGDTGTDGGIVPTSVCVGLASVLGLDPSLCHTGTGSANPAGDGTSADQGANVGAQTPAASDADTTPLDAWCTRTTSASSIPDGGELAFGALLALLAFAAGRTRRRFGAARG